MEYGYGVNGGNRDYTNKETGVQLSPFGFLRSGLYDYVNGNPNYRGDRGFYWSSLSNGGKNAYSLSFRSSFLSYRGNDFRGLGFTVRCGGK